MGFCYHEPKVEKKRFIAGKALLWTKYFFAGQMFFAD